MTDYDSGLDFGVFFRTLGLVTVVFVALSTLLMAYSEFSMSDVASTYTGVALPVYLVVTFGYSVPKAISYRITNYPPRNERDPKSTADISPNRYIVRQGISAVCIFGSIAIVALISGSVGLINSFVAPVTLFALSFSTGFYGLTALLHDFSGNDYYEKPYRTPDELHEDTVKNFEVIQGTTVDLGDFFHSGSERVFERAAEDAENSEDDDEDDDLPSEILAIRDYTVDYISGRSDLAIEPETIEGLSEDELRSLVRPRDGADSSGLTIDDDQLQSLAGETLALEKPCGCRTSLDEDSTAFVASKRGETSIRWVRYDFGARVADRPFVETEWRCVGCGERFRTYTPARRVGPGSGLDGWVPRADGKWSEPTSADAATDDEFATWKDDFVDPRVVDREGALIPKAALDDVQPFPERGDFNPRKLQTYLGVPPAERGDKEFSTGGGPEYVGMADEVEKAADELFSRPEAEPGLLGRLTRGEREAEK